MQDNAAPFAPKGVYAAVATPTGADWKPDIPRFLDHCRWLLGHGCDGLAPLGTTGEANSLGLSERVALVARLAESDIPMNRAIIGTGATSIEDAVHLSRAALEAGAAGLLMLPPFYYKNPSEDGLYAFYSRIAERIGDLEPRILLYHFPQMSAVPVSVSLTRRLRENFPGMFAGLKDSSGEIGNTAAFLEAFPGFAAFAGSETLMTQTAELGGWGCISATTNVSAPLVARRLRSRDAEEIESLDRQIAFARDAIARCGNIGGTKAVLAAFRNDPAWATAVPPNLAIDPRAAVELVRALDAETSLRAHFNV